MDGRARLCAIWRFSHRCCRRHTTAFRLVYYGEWLPNTVYAKATGLPTAHLLDTGLEYAAEVSLRRRRTSPFVALLLTPLALVRRERWWPVGFLVVSAVGYCAVVVMAGGDHMAAHRLLLPLVPALAMLCAEGLAGFTSIRTEPNCVPRQSRWPERCSSSSCPPHVTTRAEVPDPAAYIGTIVGEHLRATYRPGTLVALHTAGSTPYFAPDLKFIDMLGLNDSHIAHRRIDRLELYAQTLAPPRERRRQLRPGTPAGRHHPWPRRGDQSG